MTHVGQFGAMLAAGPEQFAAVADISGPVPIRILRVLGNAARRPDVAALTRLNGPQTLLRL